MKEHTISNKLRIILVLGLPLLLTVSCSRKHSSAKNTSTTVAVKKGPWPKTLTLDDRAAKKAVDGRLYFDLEGKRYWKNYKDGKYYLFDQAMYGNPDFKPRPAKH